MLASGFTPVGKDFPVFLHPDTHDEYALARTERKHGRGYRGFEFFATPEVTLEDDLRRRDLTINAMARGPDGELIDPYGGADDLRVGVLRHVSPAFAEDPLRVLRVARFAARFGFSIAAETLGLMRELVASGELAALAPERVWQELSRGLAEAHPSRMLQALRACGALAALLPEIDALYAVRGNGDDAGAFTERAIDWTAAQTLPLPVRYAARCRSRRAGAAPAIASRSRVAVTARRPRFRTIESAEIDAARLAARWVADAAHADALPPARLLDVIVAADALRRPERLDWLVGATCAHVASQGTATCAATLLRDALNVVRGVDASAIARDAIARAAERTGERNAQMGDAIGSALREARLAALRRWRKRNPAKAGFVRRRRRA
jgi:tRNA nucleotidyltransferase (CCA-adding enzyme)